MKKYKKYLKSVILKFPEGILKNLIRILFLQFRHSLPYELRCNFGDTFLNVGTHNIKKIKRYWNLIGRNGKLILIEPEPNNIKNIKDFLKNKDWDNVYLIEKAAWNKTEKIKFIISSRSGDHKIQINNVIHDNDLDPEREYINELVVDTITLDDIWKRFGQIDFIFIAVNGAELEVLKGAKRLLAASKPRLWIKGHALLNSQPINKMVVKLLHEFNFKSIITASSKGIVKGWEKRAGDVYAWK